MAVRRTRQRQGGVALLIFVLLLVMGALTYIVNNLSAEALRARKTADALAEAREALLGYAIQYRESQLTTGTDNAVYGFLPMPDVGTSRFHPSQPACNTEGCAMNFVNGAFPATTDTIVGRFPWRSLGTKPLRDGHGECLWYIVSAGHKSLGIDAAKTMNWDTLGQLDVVVANGTAAMTSALATAHDRPVAIIFSPGPPLPGQDRSASATDVVTECGGNYAAANYLDPGTTALDGTTNYFSAATNQASGNDPIKALSTQGSIHRNATAGTLWANACPQGGNCSIAANDAGLALTGDTLFGAIRKNTNFRLDINTLLDRMVYCLRDEIAAGGGPVGYDKIAGADANTCYGSGANPLGYYPHYRELVFVARGSMAVNGDNCAAALLFANQRGTGQLRDTVANKSDPSKYLEDINLTSFTAGTTFSGPEQFERVSATQTISRDIVRCIPTTPNLVTVNSPVVTGVGPLATYQPGTQTLTLGQEVATALDTSVAGALYGCAWRPETHAMGSGFRSYFSFKIVDSGWSSALPRDGFTFAMVDGDNNSAFACGAAQQHLGYSGNNGFTPYVAAPKIGFEIDLRRQGTFTPGASNTLSNGRNDPSYTGGHVGIAYWGGETSIATGTAPPCDAPRVEIAGACFLPQEEDDNVHNNPIGTRAGFPTPPRNPLAPLIPVAYTGVYKLDPSLSSTPTNKDFHVRIEVNRTAASYTLPTARAATTTDVSLAAPGTAYFDGVIPSNGDRILVKDQSAATENGLYVWNGASAAMTRADDADTAVELAGLLVEVQQGSQNARQIFRQTTSNLTLGSDALRWANMRVKVATTADVTLASPGVTAIDGITLESNDRILVKAQTAAAENGIYLWHGSGSPMTRSTDADTSAELTGLAVQVGQGAEASAWWQFDGSTWQRRTAVRAATQAAVDLASPGANIDGIALVAGDRVLVNAQTDAKQNGIYVWTGAATAMTRAADADAAAELAGALVLVREGTDAGRTFRQTALAASATLDSAAVQWSAIDPSPRYSIDVWILPDSPTTAGQITAMKNTTRSMATLYPGFTAHLHTAPTIPYPFRNVRLGFTLGQRTNITDQTISISDFFTSWIE